MARSDALPLVEELVDAPEAETALRRLAAWPHCVFFDSALRGGRLGRYSFLAADPFDFLVVPADGSDALALLAQRMGHFAGHRQEDLPPFQGGAAGMLGYDLAESLERLPHAVFDEFRTPALAVGFYDVVVAWDHLQGRAWIISQGFPEQDPAARRQRATRRMAWLKGVLQSEHDVPAPVPRKHPDKPTAETPCSVLAPQYAVPRFPGVTSNFSADGYRAAVRRVIDYILAGDVFQVNLAQRLLLPAQEEPLAVYLRLRQCNSAPFAGYFNFGEGCILSASPERLVHLIDGQVEARPIKGTRPRSGNASADLAMEEELLRSDKDRAENLMIVDLLRNDLSRVCRPESVRVGELCRLERYQSVVHLVSSVCGSLREGLGAVDLLQAAFPGGSIAGAPKIRAMQIIAELERCARGAYCGSLGYIGFDGTMDMNILIRTITASHGWLQCCVGGGIVARSDPQREYDETWAKAEGMLRAVPFSRKREKG